MTDASQTSQAFLQLADLASERLGGKVLIANDEFFAPKQGLLKDSKPVFIEGKYTTRGKWMDGWETRRRRTPGYDWCILRLGLPGVIRGIVVDTSFFTGNYPEQFSLDGCDLGLQAPYKNEAKRLTDPSAKWIELFPGTTLKGDSRNIFKLENAPRFTHLRLKIYPDGGVARLRIHGEAIPGAKRLARGPIDLVAVENGGTVVTSNDQFYGAPRNMLMPGRGKNMGDGWETRRRRGPGHDWVILKLGVPGKIQRVVVDTAHFKGNFPDRCSLEAVNATGGSLSNFAAATHVWREILPETKLKPNHIHTLNKLHDIGVVTHVRFNIYPDGGVSRLRLFGRAATPADTRFGGVDRFNRAKPAEAREMLLDCCGSRAWADEMLKHLPYPDAAYALDTADKIWASLEHQDWLEAFQHHPAIGAKRANSQQSATARRWSKGEQSTAQQKQTSPQTMAALVEANSAYSERFGHVFLICATGKTSDEILKHLRQRLSNDPKTELRIAAEEQRKITRLRLEKVFSS
jgi:allantoicase